VRGKHRTMPSLIVVIVCITLGVAGFVVAVVGAFWCGQAREENRANRYLRSLSHLYTPDGKGKP